MLNILRKNDRNNGHILHSGLMKMIHFGVHYFLINQRITLDITLRNISNTATNGEINDTFTTYPVTMAAVCDHKEDVCIYTST